MKETDSYSKVKCYLTADKAGEVYARDIVTEAGVEILTPDKLICTLDEGGSIEFRSMLQIVPDVPEIVIIP